MGSGKDFDTKIYFITDSTGFAEDEFMWRVESALQGGVNIMQLREKNRTTREYILLADKVHIIAKKYNVPLIIDDMAVYIARKILGDSIIIGATAKTVPQAVEAYDQGADYLGVGAIYPTTTKVKTVLTSTDTLRDICAAVPIKVNAIGGLNKNNIDILQGIPIAGICAVSAIMKAGNPKLAVKELKCRAVELGLGNFKEV